MQKIDLNRHTEAITNITCDVCIVGAGAAGLYVAAKLSRFGLRIAVLEAGSTECTSGESIGMIPEFCADIYRGATEGRAFGWGGSTSRWGGVLVPHSDVDLSEQSDSQSAVWKHIVSTVGERSGAVFSALGLSGSPTFFSFPPIALGEKTTKLLRNAGLVAMAAEFLPFTRRNLTYLLTKEAHGNVTTYLNAVAHKWYVKTGFDSTATISTLEAASTSGKRLGVSASTFIITAGAIESARILLEIDCQTHGRVLHRASKVGWYLSDHLSCPIANVGPDDRIKTARMFGPRFCKGRMRSFRFVDTSTDHPNPRHFAHFLFDIDDEGFTFLKGMLFNMQRRTLRGVGCHEAVGAFKGMSRLAYSRLLRSRLSIPEGTPARLQLDVEQAPNPSNRIQLSHERDCFGRPIATITWRADRVNYDNIAAMTNRLLEKWPGPSNGFPRLTAIWTEGNMPKPYDAYHPVGTCRMGMDAEACVNLDLRVKGTQNLFVLSTGIFPSSGSANPTFSMLCFGELLAQNLAQSNVLRKSA